MSGQALQNFSDFMLETGPAYFGAKDDIVNDAAKRTYVIKRLMFGNDKKQFQGGTSIKDVIMFETGTTVRNVNVNQRVTWSMPQVTREHSVPWRFTMGHAAWTMQEILLNKNGGDSAVEVQYKDRMRQIKQRLWTEYMNFLENQIWKLPNAASMETAAAADGGDQYSLPVYLNEGTTALHGSTFGGTAWTTIQQLNPTSEANWIPQRTQYDANDPDDSDGDSDGLFDAFDNMASLVKFDKPGNKDEYFSDPAYRKQFVCCSRRGYNLYQKMSRESNDNWGPSRQDRSDPAFGNLNYRGVELVEVDQLSDAELYPGSATTWYTENHASVSTAGPRFYWINGNYLLPIFHTEVFFMQDAVITPPDQPLSRAMPVHLWWNMFCRSRKRQGFIYPGA